MSGGGWCSGAYPRFAFQMSQTLPPVRTAGNVTDVGQNVAAAFGARRSAPVAPASTAPAQAVQEDDGMGWDPTEVLARHSPTQPALVPAACLTLGQLWEAQDRAAVGENADWDPSDVRRPVAEHAPAQLSGAQLAAHALSRLSART